MGIDQFPEVSAGILTPSSECMASHSTVSMIFTHLCPTHDRVWDQEHCAAPLETSRDYLLSTVRWVASIYRPSGDRWRTTVLSVRDNSGRATVGGGPGGLRFDVFWA